MRESIEIFEEILKHDPSAKIFFPLAKLHQEAGAFEKGISVLQRGLENHPDHFDAKCLLVELLNQGGRRQEAAVATEDLAQLIGKNVGFLKSWGQLLQDQGKDDAALALRFLTASLEGKEPRWTALFSRALDSTAIGTPSIPAARREDRLIEASHQLLSHDPVSGRQVSLGESEPVLPIVSSSFEIEPLASVGSSQPEKVNGSKLGVQDDDSLVPNTRTMAEILTQQGAFDQALEIYNKLWENTPPGLEKEELGSHISFLKAKVTEKTSVPTSLNGDKAKDRVITTLESLVSRLESRRG